MGQPRRYKVCLYQAAVPETFEWDENAVLGFLAGRLEGAYEDANRVIAEVSHKGTATRIIRCADGDAKVVVLLRP